MAVKVQFNLRFVLVAVVPCFILLGFTYGTVDGPAEPTLVSWTRYIGRMALATYIVSITWWMAVLYAWVFFPRLRRLLGNHSDTDRIE